MTYDRANLSPIQLNQNIPTSIIDKLKNNRTVFDLSQTLLTTIQPDLVYPLFWEEIIPTDTFEINTSFGGYLATPLFPTLDNLWIQYDWWFVPNRLTWPHFLNMFGERQLSGGGNPNTTSYLVPIIDDTSKEYSTAAGTIAAQGFQSDGLMGYLLAGNDVLRPMQTSLGNYVTSLLPRAYMLIGYSWYWDQIFGTIFVNAAGTVEAALGDFSLGMETGDGPDNCAKFQLFKKAKKKDMFTQLRPGIMDTRPADAFLGDVLGMMVPLTANTLTPTVTDNITRKSSAALWKAYQSGNNTLVAAGDILADGGGGLVKDAAYNISLDPNGGLELDLSDLGVSINNIRLYEKIQQVYERQMRSGSRYVEYAFVTYGNTIEDARLQLPEWLGGHTERLQMSAIAQTSQTSGTDALGQLAAFGTLVSHAPTITKSFSEHGYIMCLATVFPDLTYQQGIDRKLQRRTRYDFHDPLWENLTEQPHYNREFRIANNATDDDIAGYGPRFGEMKSNRRKLSGYMRSNHPLTLDAYHYAQELPTTTELDTVFRCYNSDIGRTQAVSADPCLILYGEAQIKAARPMQLNPEPLLGGY